jgi:thiamine-phosphate pyrophosphorylase
MPSSLNFRVIFITGSLVNSDLFKIIHHACNAGIKAVQLRLKDISASEYLKAAYKTREITEEFNTKLFINDRYDIAMLSRSDGLHSPEGGISPLQVHRESKFIFGRSVHSAAAAIEAEKAGYDYLLFGPVFRTPSKVKYGRPMGLEKLDEVCHAVNIPVFAVGGINPYRAAKCITKGAYGIAVIRELMLSENIKKTVNEFNKIISLNV